MISDTDFNYFKFVEESWYNFVDNLYLWTLYLQFLEGVIRSSGINRQGTLNTKSHQCLAYAYDVILMANSNKELSRITTNLIEEGGKDRVTN